MTRTASPSSPPTKGPFGCDQCGYATGRWMGFCPQCRKGSLVPIQPAAPWGRAEGRAVRPVAVGAVLPAASDRRTVGIGELDGVLGAGVVPGSAVVIGGDPGVGKSTLLLQVAAAVGRAAEGGGPVLYASAEETAAQVAARARRVGAVSPSVLLLEGQDVEGIVGAADSLSPELVIVDSIQTVRDGSVDGIPGGVAQVRACADRLVRWARSAGVPVLLVAHVTKEGAIAGPRSLEHLVDTVLYLEGDPRLDLRVLRPVKNRFGPLDRAALFTMTETGLSPADAVLATGDVSRRAPGVVAHPAVIGNRVVTVDVEALVAPAAVTPARRSSQGLAAGRLAQVLAVLERHVGLRLSHQDVYVSVSGGLRPEPAALDLPVALAVASSALDRPVGAVAAWGEIGLTGVVRGVGRETARSEAATSLGLEPVEAMGRPVGDVMADIGLAGIRRAG